MLKVLFSQDEIPHYMSIYCALKQDPAQNMPDFIKVFINTVNILR